MKNRILVFCIALILCGASHSSAAERLVDTDIIAAPRTAYANQKREKEMVKEPSAAKREWNLRNRKRESLVICKNGNFSESNNNLIFEVQIGNLKRIKIRTCSGAESLAWATYDAYGNVCRLGPPAKVATTGDIAPNAMDKFEIIFAPRERVVCFSVGKAVRGKLKILYFTEAAQASDDTAK